MPQDLAFRSAAAAQSPNASAARTVKVPDAPAEREQLPSAYRAQTEVDVAAEVTAFRDKE